MTRQKNHCLCLCYFGFVLSTAIIMWYVSFQWTGDVSQLFLSIFHSFHFLDHNNCTNNNNSQVQVCWSPGHNSCWWKVSRASQKTRLQLSVWGFVLTTAIKSCSVKAPLTSSFKLTTSVELLARLLTNLLSHLQATLNITHNELIWVFNPFSHSKYSILSPHSSVYFSVGTWYGDKYWFFSSLAPFYMTKQLQLSCGNKRLLSGKQMNPVNRGGTQYRSVIS